MGWDVPRRRQAGAGETPRGLFPRLWSSSCIPPHRSIGNVRSLPARLRRYVAAFRGKSFGGSCDYRRILCDRPPITKRGGDRPLYVFLDELLRRFNRFCEVGRCARPIGKGFDLRLQEFRRDQAYAFKRLQTTRGSEGVEIDDRQRAGLEVATRALLSEGLPVIDAEEDDIRTRRILVTRNRRRLHESVAIPMAFRRS